MKSAAGNTGVGNADSFHETVGEAARWFLRLQDEAVTAQTFADWNKWLSVSSEHRRAYEEIEETVLRLKRVPVMPELPSAAEMDADTYDGTVPVREFLAKTRRNRRWGHYAVAAAIVAVCVLGAGLWMYYSPQSQFASLAYETDVGKRRVVELPDGSMVTLDANSALSAQITRARRALTLLRGEAYFQVAKNRSWPFVVQAGKTQVTAVGTAFNVRMSANRTVVAVVEGKVDVVTSPYTAVDAKVAAATPRLTAQVAAGEAVSYVDDGDLHALPAAEALLATGWLDGRRQYRNEPLRYVLSDVDRYTGRRIEVADEATGALRFTGTVDLTNSEAWLRGLSVALPVTATQRADGSVFVKQR